MDLASFFVTYKVPLLFYLAVIIIIYAFRKKISWQGPLIGLYKTQIGVKLMKSLATKHRELFRWLGYVGVGAGFTGMLFIVWMLIQGLWQLIFHPDAPAVIAPVIPGFNIPGVGITVPLITGWLALFLVIVVHEFSHGVVSKAHDIPIESSGLLVFGPILGAFVEPNEKKLIKADDVVQYSIFAAGPFSNMIAGFVFYLVASFIIVPIILAMTVPAGIALTSVGADSPAALAGLNEGTIIVGSNGMMIANAEDFMTSVDTLREGDELTVIDNQGQSYVISAGSDGDDDTDKGKIGITLANEREAKNPAVWYDVILKIVYYLREFFKWAVILNLGIGLANLLPLGPVDGGRMVQVLMTKLYGEKKGTKKWKQITKVTLFVILVLLLVPIIKSLVF